MGVNLAGCLLLGMVLGWTARRGELSEAARCFITVGVLGGFTTFSTYAGDALKLLQSGRGGVAFAYMTLSAVLGLAACWAGYVLLSR